MAWVKFISIEFKETRVFLFVSIFSVYFDSNFGNLFFFSIKLFWFVILYIYFIQPCKPTGIHVLLLFSGWGDWSDWSACNVSCDTGLQYRQRRCQKCGQGHNKEFRKCNDFPCDGTLNVICLYRQFSCLVEFRFNETNALLSQLHTIR